jgi:RNA polymerase sigma-70 factor (ECF subfamily)
MMRVHKDPADPRAWDDFVVHYQPTIRAWCLKWGSQPADADDVAQDVLLKLLTAMKNFQYDPGRSFRAWLKTVTQNAWNDFATSHRMRSGEYPSRFEEIADPGDALADLEEKMENAFHRELLELAMRRVEKRVKPLTWHAFRLMAIENRQAAEAAEELQMQIAHVFVAKHRVQKMLEEEIQSLRERHV